MNAKKLFDETYSSSDGKQKIRNLWYGYFDISIDVILSFKTKFEKQLTENKEF